MNIELSELKDLLINNSSEGSKLSKHMIGKYVIIRTYSAGVHCGELVAHDGMHVLLKDCRMIWSWEGAFTLSAVAENGISKESKLTVVVPERLLTEAIEIIPCSAKATKILQEMDAYEPA